MGQGESRMHKSPIANDFVFEVSPGEAEDLRRLRSQSVTLKPGRGQHPKLPKAPEGWRRPRR